MRKKMLILAAFVILGFCCFTAKAETIVRGREAGNVNDYSGVLDEEALGKISDMCYSVKQRTPDPVEIVVAIFPAIDKLNFSEFCYRFGEKWRQEKKGRRDNGIVIVVVLESGRVSIGVGQNLKDILTIEITNAIIRDKIKPNFKDGEYGEGLISAIQEIKDILDRSTIPSDVPIVRFVIAITVLLYLAYRIRKRRNMKRATQS